jgi:hypothetical protein
LEAQPADQFTLINMFGKLTAGLKRAGRGSHGAKYRLEVQVLQVKGLPAAVKRCRVVWSRSAKVQMTDVKDVKSSGMCCSFVAAVSDSWKTQEAAAIKGLQKQRVSLKTGSCMVLQVASPSSKPLSRSPRSSRTSLVLWKRR